MTISAVFSKLCLKVLGIKVTLRRPSPKMTSSAVYVSNHMSYLDVLIIMSNVKGSFVTSVEIKETFGLGWLCRIGGCSYTERRSIWNVAKEVKNLQSVLESETNVVFFPEGTTTPGTYLRPFKSSLLESAARSNRMIVPVYINYTEINGIKPRLEDRDSVCWYGSMTFLPHLIRLCMLQSVSAEIGFLDPVNIKPYGERKIVAKKIRSDIEAYFKPMAIVEKDSAF